MSATEADGIELERRIRVAYATALRHAHEGGIVQVHAGETVVAYFKSLAKHPRHPLLNGLVSPTAFGYPLIEAAESLGADYIGIHILHPIH